MDQEILKNLNKKAIKIVPTKQMQGQLRSTLFLVPKKDTDHRTVIYLKKLNQPIRCKHLKMEGLFLLEKILEEGDYICKIDLTDAYFIYAHQDSQKFVRFSSKDHIYEFGPMFRPGPSTMDFNKSNENSNISLLRKLTIRLIFLDDTMIMASSVEEMTPARDILIQLLQGLGFLINVNCKSVLELCQTLQFLGVEINFKEMTLFLPQD